MKNPEFLAHSVEHKRIYLLEELPPPLTRSGEHWQIFDNYDLSSGARLRRVRIPATGEWFRAIEQRNIISAEGGLTEEVTRTVLNDEDYLDSGWDEDKKYEVRKNRYFTKSVQDEREFAVDLILGELWGIIFAQTRFETAEEMRAFAKPAFALLDVSASEFFRGNELTSASLAEVRSEVAKLLG